VADWSLCGCDDDGEGVREATIRAARWQMLRKGSNKGRDGKAEGGGVLICTAILYQLDKLLAITRAVSQVDLTNHGEGGAAVFPALEAPPHIAA
jgi:hypothetical protein